MADPALTEAELDLLRWLRAEQARHYSEAQSAAWFVNRTTTCLHPYVRQWLEGVVAAGGPRALRAQQVLDLADERQVARG